MSMRSASPTTVVPGHTPSISVFAKPVTHNRDVEADDIDAIAYGNVPHQRFTEEVRSGTTICLDSRFYLCVDRLGLGGGGHDDILVLVRIPLSKGVLSTLHRCSASNLDELARQGRAALVGGGGPRTPRAAHSPRPKPAGPAPAAIAMPV